MKGKLIFSSYDSPKNPYYGGGGALQTHKIASELAKRGYSVTYLCGKFPKSSNQNKIDGVQYKYLGIDGVNFRISQLIFPFFLWIETLKGDFNIWFENFYPPFSTSLIPLLTKKPVVGIASLLHAEKFRDKYGFPFDRIENFGLRHYKEIILLSTGLESKIRNVNKNVHIEIIPRTINSKYLKMKTKKENYILYLGRLDIFQKGLDLLIPAWKKYSEKNPKDLLIIAGGGLEKEKEELFNLIKQNEVNDSVKYVGKVEGKQKETLLANSNFGICPSRFESFGNVALEFLAFGKTIVSFDIPGFSYIPDKLVFFAKEIGYKALAKAISRAKNSEKTIKGKEARNFAKKFTVDKIVNEYESLIKTLIQI